VGSSWPIFVSRCKSRLSALARSCFLGREHWFRKYQQAKQAEKELRELLANSEAGCRELEKKNQDLRERVVELQAELANPRPLELPLGDVPPGQQYGAHLMELSVNLARKLGVRRSERAQKIF
jgi:hypothetical protein